MRSGSSSPPFGLDGWAGPFKKQYQGSIGSIGLEVISLLTQTNVEGGGGRSSQKYPDNLQGKVIFPHSVIGDQRCNTAIFVRILSYNISL